MIDNENNKSVKIGEELKKFFKKKKITQKNIADKLGVSQAAIGALLNGKPFGKKTAKIWAGAFGIQPSWLLTGEGTMLHEKNINDQIIIGNDNIQAAGSSRIDARRYYSDSPDVLKAQIDLLEKRIKEKDAQIKEKDAQINKLLSILSNK